MRTSTGSRTKAQQRRFDRIKEIGCIGAHMRGLGWVYAEVHHLISGNKRRGHDFTVGLSPWLHRGVVPEGYTRSSAESTFGPSLANGSKPFREAFGDDNALLEYQNRLLGEL